MNPPVGGLHRRVPPDPPEVLGYVVKRAGWQVAAQLRHGAAYRFCLAVAALFFAVGCDDWDAPREDRDIYRKFAPGTPLTMELLADSIQICPHGTDLVTTYDLVRPMSDHRYNPHILFWNSQHKLVSATYFAGQHIKRIEGGTIFGDFNESRSGWSDAFRQDVPPGYRLQLHDDNPNGYGSSHGTVLDAIHLSEDGVSVTMRVRKGPNPFEYPPDTPSGLPGVTTLTQTMPLCEIMFGKHGRDQAQLLLREKDHRGYHWNDIRVPRPELLDEFRQALWKHLHSVRAEGVTAPPAKTTPAHGVRPG